jgi:hypothetical protein
MARDNPLSAYPESDYQLVAGPGQKFPGGERSWMGNMFGSPQRALIVPLAAAPEPAQEAMATERGTEPPASPPVSEVAPAPTAPSGLEDKLRTLKKLRDDGLITEADYEMKKQELLKGF